jgi:primosomal protein N'
MDWTKVRTKHYISNGLSLKEKGILVTYVCLVAHLEKIPTVSDLQFTFQSKWLHIVPTFERIYGHSDIEIATKVLEDVDKLNEEKERNRCRQKTYRESHANATQLCNTVEKRREEKIHTYTDCFEKFWTSYPKKKAKEKALQAFMKLQIKNGLLEKILKAIDRQKHSEQWKKDNGQFIPFPATWLNGKRWEDQEGVALSATTERKANAKCEACNGSGKLPDGNKCWCYS